MKLILLIDRTEPTNAKITIVKNSFVDNLAFSAVYLVGSAVNISYNIFDNFEVNKKKRFKKFFKIPSD